MAPFLAAIVFLGVYPGPVLDRVQPAVDALIRHVDEHAPQFSVPEVTVQAPELAAPASEAEAEAESE